MHRTVTKALIGGGGGGRGYEYSYIRVLHDEFLLKSTVMTTDLVILVIALFISPVKIFNDNLFKFNHYFCYSKQLYWSVRTS